jgi:hypothetical protein
MGGGGGVNEKDEKHSGARQAHFFVNRMTNRPVLYYIQASDEHKSCVLKAQSPIK